MQSRVTRVEGRRRGDDEDSNEFLTEGTEIDKLNRLANSQFSDSTNFRSNFHAFPGNNIFKTKGGRYQ